MLDQHGITKLVSAVVVLHKCRIGLIQHSIAREGSQKLEVAFAGLVHAGEDRVDDPERGFTNDASSRNAVSGAHGAVRVSGRLNRADDSSSDGDDAPTFRLRLFD